MGKLIKVDKEKLKISAEEHEKMLREDEIIAKWLEERDRELRESLKRLKEEK